MNEYYYMNTILLNMYRLNQRKFTFNYLSSLSCLSLVRHQSMLFWLPKWPTGDSELWTIILIQDTRTIRSLSKKHFLAHAKKRIIFSSNNYKHISRRKEINFSASLMHKRKTETSGKATW